MAPIAAGTLANVATGGVGQVDANGARLNAMPATILAPPTR
ncbi:hypothetical protein [Chloroflexus sp.]|nr:hypothetical protein [Chloroflexus sp.]